MLTTNQLEQRLVALGEHRHDGKARSAIAARLDNLLPAQTITTNAFAATKRWMVHPGGEPFRYDPKKTPYAAGIHDAMDMPEVRVVAVKGNTRSAKTVSAENYALRMWTYGPLTNVLWFMQDEDSLNDYIDERGEEMLKIHEVVNGRIDWTDRKNGRKRKKIGSKLLLYRPATMRSTRSKAAPLIVADEIDAYQKKIRDAIMTLVTSRQEEFGNSAKAYLASHPDAGPDGGIDAVLAESLVHLWWVRCPCCGHAASPAAEADVRWAWNVPELMARAEDMPRNAFLKMVETEVRLVCPNSDCRQTFDTNERVDLMADGMWLQPHQRLLEDGTVEGDPLVQSTMGFVIHAFMSPFAKMHETARRWAAAKLMADRTGNDVPLKEVFVKLLGETYRGSKPEEQVEDWKIVQARCSRPYEMKTVPPGVKFLTAFVDVQGDRFEVRVIGWDLMLRSWLIDTYSIKQWPRSGEHGAFDNIDPGNRLSDWDILEPAVLNREYPLADQPDLYLPIAKVMIDEVGVPGVTNNARVWLANLLSRKDGPRYPLYRVNLVHGSKFKSGELYGKPTPHAFDENGKKLEVQIYSRQPIVHLIKKIIARRMKVEDGPGAMMLPSNTPPRIWRELTAENFVNDEWVKIGQRNETWDAWVMCEAARAVMQPDRPGMWDVLPDWATPRPKGASIDSAAAIQVSMFDRLAQVNAGT